MTGRDTRFAAKAELPPCCIGKQRIGITQNISVNCNLPPIFLTKIAWKSFRNGVADGVRMINALAFDDFDTIGCLEGDITMGNIDLSK